MPDDTVRPPAFRMYPKDILADAKCQRMDLAEFGAYMWLLLTSWEEPLPSDIRALARLAKHTPPAKMRKIWDAIGVCFVEDAAHPGHVVQPRLEEERAKAIRFAQTRSAAGKRGVQAKNERREPGFWPDENQAYAEGELEQKPSKTEANAQPGLKQKSSCSLSFTYLYSDSLRSSAAAVGVWPEESAGLRALALIFLDAFGNCREEKSVGRHVAEYMNFLATCRSRGVTIEAAWDACREALQARDSKPLFGASVKGALSYLRGSRPGRKAHVADVEGL